MHCAFGISLKACLLQSLLYILPAVLPLQQCGAAAAHICVSRALVSLGACRVLGSPALSNVPSIILALCFALIWEDAFSALCTLSACASPRHEVRPANPLNLSI